MTQKTLLQEAHNIVDKLDIQKSLKSIKIRQDNRIRSHGMADIKNDVGIITLNLKKIKNIHSLRLTLLHELGHLIYPVADDLIELEYLAHKFCLDILKAFYNESYDYAFQCLKDSIENENFCNQHPDHAEAFRRLYNDTV